MLDIVFWGTYDLTKPRQKILIEAANRAGFSFIQIHSNLWKLKDKSEYNLLTLLFIMLIGKLRTFPLLIKYIFCSPHKYVFIGYPGFLDLFLIWPLARLKKARIVYDCYLPLYEILVEERKIVRASGLSARIILRLEKIIHQIADILLTDTRAHAEYISSYSGAPINKIKVVYVGAESFFERNVTNSARDKFKVLFYGQVAPLHGFGCIAKSIKILKNDHNIHFSIIGGRDETPEVQDLINCKLPNLEYKQWVDYENLTYELASADLCLGIFGNTDKAKRVIANKVYQALSAGTTVITGATKAISEIEVQVPDRQLIQVALDDELQLAEAIRSLARKKEENMPLKFAPKSFYPQIIEQLRFALINS